MLQFEVTLAIEFVVARVGVFIQVKERCTVSVLRLYRPAAVPALLDPPPPWLPCCNGVAVYSQAVIAPAPPAPPPLVPHMTPPPCAPTASART